MIVRRLDPKHPEREIYVPLAFDHDKGEWVGLVKQAGFADAIDAGKVCVTDMRESYAKILQTARITLALCEHHGFNFSEDGVDADMIRDTVRALTRTITDVEENLKYLLDEPRSDERIRLGEALYKVNPATRRLRPMEPHELKRVSSSYDSPDRLFTRLIVSSVARAQSLTGRSITQEGIDDAIAILQRLQNDLYSEDPGEEYSGAMPAIERASVNGQGSGRMAAEQAGSGDRSSDADPANGENGDGDE